MKKRPTEQSNSSLTLLDELLIEHDIILQDSSKQLYDNFCVNNRTIINLSEDGIHATNNIDKGKLEQLNISLNGECSLSISLFGEF